VKLRAVVSALSITRRSKMKTLLRDLFVMFVTAGTMLALMGWWNAPAYKACAKSHSQEFCYTVLK